MTVVAVSSEWPSAVTTGVPSHPARDTNIKINIFSGCKYDSLRAVDIILVQYNFVVRAACACVGHHYQRSIVSIALFTVCVTPLK